MATSEDRNLAVDTWGAWGAMKALRKMAKEANLAGDRVNPKTEFQAGIGLFYYFLALAS